MKIHPPPFNPSRDWSTKGKQSSKLGTWNSVRSSVPKAIMGFISVISPQPDVTSLLPDMIWSCWCHSPNGRVQNVIDKHVGFPVGADANTVSSAIHDCELPWRTDLLYAYGNCFAPCTAVTTVSTELPKELPKNQREVATVLGWL